MGRAPQNLQPSPVPYDAVEPFRGEWVVLDGGEVIAHAATGKELVATGKVRSDTLVMRVPRLNSLHG